MKNILSILTVLALAAAAQAGCGVNVTTEGLLKSYDAAKKQIVVTPLKGAKDVTITITPETEGVEGLKERVGKGVKVEASKHSATKAISIADGSADGAKQDLPKGDEKKDKKNKKEKKA